MDRRHATMVAAFAVLATAAVLVGCGPRVPSDPPAMTGRIVLATPSDTGGAGGGILVEGAGTVGDKAALGVTDATTILIQAKDGLVSSATFADLTVGRRVSVWITGPVRESYPVQAEASTIVIVE